MKIKHLLYFFILFLASCGTNQSNPVFVTTNAPLAMILQEIVGTKAKVEFIVPVGASPHSFSPKPSNALSISKATAFFYTSKSIDEWATKMENNNIIEILKLLPKDVLVPKSWMNDYSYHNTKNSAKKSSDSSLNYDIIDPHFWTDPMTVKALIKPLVDTLSKIDPANANSYKTNGDAFSKKLDVLDRQVSLLVQNIKNKPIFTNHPSFSYFFKRYGLTYGGSIEKNPGQEPTPGSISSLLTEIKNSGVKAIFSEPQMADKTPQILSNEAGVNIYFLDPIGGTPDKKFYNDLILYNAKTLKEALD